MRFVKQFLVGRIAFAPEFFDLYNGTMNIPFVQAKNTLIALGVIVATLALSGFGYPNDGTVIIGPDVREGANGLYEIFLDVPQSVHVGDTITVKATVEFAKDFTGSSTATVNVTGGSLQNEQSQDLKPSSSWNIQAQSGSLVGIVISTQTKIAPKDKPESETTYWDTVSSSISVVSSGTQKSASVSPHDIAKAFESNSHTKLLVFIFFVLVVGALGVYWKKRQKDSSKNH